MLGSICAHALILILSSGFQTNQYTWRAKRILKIWLFTKFYVFIIKIIMTEVNNLPPGWDTKVDRLTGKRYYINHNTKTTTWEDPRNKHKANGLPGEYIPLQDIKPSRNNTSLRPQQTQESTLTISQETDESVAKISSMFPTVTDTHIRLLLKKYMKSIFPKAEETVILDVLTSNENNIQKASDTLKGMGYERRDPVKLLQQQEAEAKREEEEKARQNEAIESIEIPLIPKIKTPEEKDRIKISLQEQYKDITEQVITIALESVEYDETRACQILQIMVQEDADNKTENTENKDIVDGLEEEEITSLQPQITIPISQSRHSFKSLITEKSEVASKDKNVSRIFKDENCNKMALGANPDYVKGPKDDLLLLDYAPWDGPDEHLRVGPKKGLAKGPNKNNLSNREYKSFGPNPDLRKGAKVGLAKGSMFKQFRNIVIGESRGK